MNKYDKSVISGKTMTEIEKKMITIWPDSDDISIRDLPDEKPRWIEPMLSILTEKPFDNKNWLFEVKWDGYRCITVKDGDQINLYSRNNRNINKDYPQIVTELKTKKESFVLDGEIVALDEAGKPRFELLQQFKRNADGKLVYYLFDLLNVNGKNIRNLPLKIRKKMLFALLSDSNIFLRISSYVMQKGINFFDAAKDQGLEGIMAKEINSRYSPGERSKSWLKIKNRQSQTAIVCGYTDPANESQYFGSLALAAYIDHKLRYIGNVGTGFDEQTQADLIGKLKKIKINISPLDQQPKNLNVNWVQPKLICEVKFQEWTKECRLRQPVYLGLRNDIELDQVLLRTKKECDDSAETKRK